MKTVSRKRRPSKPQTFRVVFEVGEDRYHVVPLTPHPEVAVSAFRFIKADGTRYDVHLNTEGQADCSCPGCTYHKKACKHIKTLVAAKMLPAAVLEPSASSNAEVPF